MPTSAQSAVDDLFPEQLLDTGMLQKSFSNVNKLPRIKLQISFLTFVVLLVADHNPSIFIGHQEFLLVLPRVFNPPYSMLI